jgi:PAS domain S-box-containing protein
MENNTRELSVLRLVAEAAVDGVAIFGRDELIAFANTAFARMYGLAYGSQLTGRLWASLFEPEWARYIQATCFDEAGEHTWSGHLVGLREDGAPFEMEASCTPLPSGLGLILIARDVSEKVRSEMELREARALFKAIIDQMPRVAIMGFGRDGRMVHCNAAARDLYGIAQGAANAPSMSEILKDGERLARVESAARLAWESGQGSQPETCRHVSEEGPKWLLSTVFPAVVQGGATEVLVVDVDITREVQSSEALRRNEARMRFILDQLPGVYFYVQDAPSGRWTYISKSVEAVTGYPPEFFQGPHEPIITDHPMNAEAGRVAAKIQSEGVEAGPYRCEILRRDGARRVLEVFEKPVRDGGVVGEIFGLAIDITERAKMEEQLSAFQRREMMGNLSRGFARQISSPMIAIFGTLDALQNKLHGDRDVSAFLHVLRQQGQRLAKLMNDLVLLGEAENAPRGPSDLIPLAHEVVASIAIFPGHEGALVRIEAPNEPLVALISPARVRQALYQILDNALFFSPEPDTVKVVLCKEGDDAVFEISDKGPGLPENESASHLFAPFVTTREDAPGLGLALAERIALEHGGRIEARNNAPGPGATFRLILPLVH